MHIVELSVYFSQILSNRFSKKFDIISFCIPLANVVENAIFDITSVKAWQASRSPCDLEKGQSDIISDTWMTLQYVETWRHSVRRHAMFCYCCFFLFCWNTWLPLASNRWIALYFSKCKGKERNIILQEYNLYWCSDCCRLTLFFIFVLKHLMSISSSPGGFSWEKKKSESTFYLGITSCMFFFIGHMTFCTVLTCVDVY